MPSHLRLIPGGRMERGESPPTAVSDGRGFGSRSPERAERLNDWACRSLLIHLLKCMGKEDPRIINDPSRGLVVCDNFDRRIEDFRTVRQVLRTLLREILESL